MEEILKVLKLNKADLQPIEGERYQYDISDSNEFARLYSRLDRSDIVEEDSESSQVTDTVTSVQFVNDNYTITLNGDLDQDIYSMIIREN